MKSYKKSMLYLKSYSLYGDSMAYQCNNTTFVSEYGDITEIDVDAMVVASCPTLTMDAGIALKIKDKGGPPIEAEAVECAPRRGPS